MRLMGIILFTIFLSTIGFARHDVEIKSFQYRPVNGGINPDVIAFDLSGYVMIPNNCWKASLQEVRRDDVIRIFAELKELDKNKCKTKTKDDFSYTVRFNKYEIDEVIVQSVEGKGDLTIYKAVTETIPTEVRDALLTVNSSGEYVLKARLFQGSNPCMAEGVEVVLEEVNRGDKTLLVPFRTRTGSRMCTREYRPVYKEVSTVISTNLDETFLENYKDRIQKKVSTLLAVLSAKTFGGFCRDACPETTIAITADGAVAKFTKTFSWHDEKEENSYSLIANLEEATANNITSKVSLVRDRLLVDSNPDSPFCADAPITEYSIISDRETIVIHRQRDCHNYSLRDYNAKKLSKILEAFSYMSR